jgi:hypothetical protein
VYPAARLSCCPRCPGYSKYNVKQKNMASSTHDPVNSPSHYTDGSIEVIDFIEDKKFGFHLGNAVKYISRAGKKNPDKKIEDLKKAIWYIQREISNSESALS